MLTTKGRRVWSELRLGAVSIAITPVITVVSTAAIRIQAKILALQIRVNCADIEFPSSMFLCALQYNSFLTE